MQIYVVLPSGESRSVDLGEGGVVVGSAVGCDLVLEGPEVSPRHAYFQIDPVGAPTVQEMGATSAVFVNGSRIDGTVALKSSDRVNIGGATFTLTVPGTPVRPPVPVPAPAPVIPATPVSAAPSAPSAPPVATQPVAPPAQPPVTSNGGGSLFKSPLILALIGVAVLLAVGLAFVAINMGDSDEQKAAASSQAPSEQPTEEPTEESPTIATPPPLSKARIDGLYNGKYDFAFKADCPSGPCGGLAQSGAQFRIPYSGSSSYRGHSTLRDTCADGGVHVQAPYKVDLVFHATDAAMVGDDWKATKVDISLTISRNAVAKKVRTSPTIVTTLNCPAYNKNAHFVAVAAT